jgi:hypothetical protein
MVDFRRYTNLAALIHILRTKELTLLNPATWEDRNDAYFMSEYKRQIRAKTVLAVCFAETKETFHHWKVFSGGSDGVCIVFRKDDLLAELSKDPKIYMRAVAYKSLAELKTAANVKVADLPFTKRFAYEDEKEFRVVYADDLEEIQFKNFQIKFHWIDRVIFSPWFSKNLRKAVGDTLRTIDGCSKLKLMHSTVIDNETWKKVASGIKS